LPKLKRQETKTVKIRRSIEPFFSVSEFDFTGASNMTVGESMEVIINYNVIEKTKSFVILRISFVYGTPQKRRF